MEPIIAGRSKQYIRSGLFEYLLVIRPGGEVCTRVMEEKISFNAHYRPVAAPGRPHITLTSFMAWDSVEDALIRCLYRIAREQQSFCVTLNNYSGFPSHTVFLRVQDQQPLKALANRLKAIGPYIKEYRSEGKQFASYPHLSIARQLSSDVYEHAIKEYACKDFNASFRVNELILLRRQEEEESCKEVSVFRLQPAFDN